MILAPVLAFFAVTACLRACGCARRFSLLLAITVCAVFLVADTEFLNLFSAITAPAVFVSWLAFFLLSAAAFTRIRRHRPTNIPKVDPRWTALERLQLASIAFFLMLIAVTALVSPPSTYDAMLYHMPRVTQWIVHRSISFFPTIDYQQLMAPPFTEWVILHLQLLWGSDRFANLPTFAGFAGSVMGVSLIAESFGASLAGQVLASLLCATLPLGVLIASGTKNDPVLTFWIVAMAAFLLRMGETSRSVVPARLSAFAAPVAAGLACFTKGTAYAFVPFVFLVCLALAKPWKLYFLRALFAAGCVVGFLLNAPHYARNLELTGSPLGFPSPNGGPNAVWANNRITPGVIFSNAVRNTAVHFGTRNVSQNQKSTHAVEQLLRAFAIDPSDPGTTWSGIPFHINWALRDENYSGNGFHLLLFLVSLGLLLFFRMERRRDLLIYSAGLIAAFLLFCATLRWQEWNQRLQLPLFALACAAMGVIFERRFSRPLLLILTIALFLAALPSVLFNHSRPLLPLSAFSKAAGQQNFSIFNRPRARLYFAGSHEWDATSYLAAARALKRSGCADVAVDASEEHFEYPLLALLGFGQNAIQPRYTGVTNMSTRYARALDRARPCAVLCPLCLGTAKEAAYSQRYPVKTVFDHLLVFSDHALK